MIPNLKFDNNMWEGYITLNNWKLFFEYENEIGLNIGGDCLVNRLSIIHEKGYSFLIKEQADLLDIILEQILLFYPNWQEEFGYEDDDKDDYMPDIYEKWQFKKLIFPVKIFIHDVSKDDMPYIGIQFNCTWDDEHGLGIMCHNKRILKIGGADVAFMSWIAEEDLSKI